MAENYIDLKMFNGTDYDQLKLPRVYMAKYADRANHSMSTKKARFLKKDFYKNDLQQTYLRVGERKRRMSDWVENVSKVANISDCGLFNISISETSNDITQTQNIVISIEDLHSNIKFYKDVQVIEGLNTYSVGHGANGFLSVERISGDNDNWSATYSVLSLYGEAETISAGYLAQRLFILDDTAYTLKISEIIETSSSDKQTLNISLQIPKTKIQDYIVFYENIKISGGNNLYNISANKNNVLIIYAETQSAVSTVVENVWYAELI